MTRYEQIKAHEPCLEELKERGLRVRDLWKAEVYEQVEGLHQQGNKMLYCVWKVAQAHHIAESNVWAIIAEMKAEVAEL